MGFFAIDSLANLFFILELIAVSYANPIGLACWKTTPVILDFLAVFPFMIEMTKSRVKIVTKFSGQKLSNFFENYAKLKKQSCKSGLKTNSRYVRDIFFRFRFLQNRRTLGSLRNFKNDRRQNFHG
jgi:hypothetical protein